MVLEFGYRDTVLNKGVGTTGDPTEFTALDTKTIIYTPGTFTGTIDHVAISATAITASSGFSAGNVPQINAKVYTSVDGTETFEIVNVLCFAETETSVRARHSMIVPINKRILGKTVIISVEFKEDDAGTGFTGFAGTAQIGYTLDS